jgi:hypothetical protein
MFSFSWATYLLCLHRMQTKIMPLKLYGILDIYVYSVVTVLVKYEKALGSTCGVCRYFEPDWLMSQSYQTKIWASQRFRHTIPKCGHIFYSVTWVRCQPNECQSLWTCLNLGLADFESQPIRLFTS